MGFKCKYCEKEYSSYQSRCNHIRNIHNKLSPKIEDNVIHLSPKKDDKIIHLSHDKYKCIKCNKEYKYHQGLWKHAKNCNKLEDTGIQEMKNEIVKLKIMLQKAMKIHPKTLTKINKQLNNSTRT